MGTRLKTITTFLLFILISSTAIAQTADGENPQNDPRYKDPSTAQILGIVITGGGHFYAGESGTGALLLGTGIVAPLVGAGLSGTTCTGSGFSTSCSNNFTPLYLGVAVAVGSWIYSIADSPKAARRTNAANGLTISNNFQIAPSMLTTNANQHGYGVKMKINF